MNLKSKINNMKNIIFTLSYLLFTTLINAQTLKTYKGNYEDGFATYQYFENAEYERILNGSFSYTTEDYNHTRNYNGELTQKQNINGQFKNNLKNGIWEVKQENDEFLNGKSRQIKSTQIGNYKNGLRDGLWSYKVIVEMNKKIETTSLSFNFNNNTLVGDINLDWAKGTLDNQGNFVGGWNLKIEGIEYIADFQNNILTKLIVRNISDGNIKLKYENLNISSFLTDSIATIDGTQYILKKLSELDENDEYFKAFYSNISKKISSLDNIIGKIKLGSTPFVIISPKMAIVKTLTYNEKQEIESKKQEAAKRIQYIEAGDLNFAKRNYKQASKEYLRASLINDTDDNIKSKIAETKTKINQIDSLLKLRFEISNLIESNLKLEMSISNSIIKKLEEKNSTYLENYKSCVNLLKLNLNNYAVIRYNFYLKYEDKKDYWSNRWDSSDDNILDIFIKYKDEIIIYNNFNSKVLKAIESENKEILKLLKKSENPKETIDKILTL